jgi:hypothetical protein
MSIDLGVEYEKSNGPFRLILSESSEISRRFDTNHKSIQLISYWG